MRNPVQSRLRLIYAEIMWLASREHVTPSVARAWYTHVTAQSLRKSIRRFTGFVSAQAASAIDSPLRLEHFKRIQTSLTALVSKHKQKNLNRPKEFVDLVLDYEQVHIVTVSENYAAMKAKGNYADASIHLVHWNDIPSDRQAYLWKRMLRGRVSNAVDYAPSHDKQKKT
ncbi:MAG: hypothetical protein M0Q93_11590 [Terrimicrobiaceae bacterium]|nr:hypothetical protein [Terrimicrobiaceae bacterium]